MRCRILMLSVAHSGHVLPWVGLAAELARRGHQVSFTTTDEFADAFSGAGQEVVRYAATAPPAIKGNPGQSSKLWNLDENSAIVDTVKTRFSDARPDVILYDMSAFYAGGLLSQIWQLPAVMLSGNFASSMQYSLDADITSRPLENSYSPALGDFLTRLGRFISAHAPDLPMHNTTLLAPWEELIVVTLPRELQIAGDTFDERWVFTGPYLDDRAFQGRWQPPSEEPVLLVSFGTSNYQGQRAFLETCVSAFTGLDWHVVLSTGPQLDPAELGPLPPNMEAHRQVPQLAILKSAKLFVSHAGMGGILEALSLSVPILAFPQLPEQHIAADRIVDLGLGRRSELDISADELRATALDLAADTSAAHALAQMREHIRKSGGAARAAEEIELHVLQG
jgi:MGT family glycosyltransferase